MSESSEVAPGGELPHLSLQGVVDLFAVSALRDLASREVARGRALDIDCEGLERIDASVLQLLLAIERGVRENGAELTLRHVPDNVARYLHIAGADVLLQRVANDEASGGASVDAAEASHHEPEAHPSQPSTDDGWGSAQPEGADVALGVLREDQTS